MEHQHAPGASRVAGRDEPLAKARSLRRRKVITAVVITGFLVDGFFAALYAVMDARAYAAAIGLNLLNAALWAVTLLLLRWSERLAGAYFLLVLIAGMVSFTILLGHASGSHLFLFLAASMSLIFLDLRPTIAPVAMTLLAWGALIISAKFLPRAPSHIPMSIDESEALFYVTSALTMVVLFVTSRYFMQLTDAAEAALELEYRRSDALLLNILPAPVAERLKHGERIADNYGSISVLFADIVGFTAGARQAGPEDTVAMLNRFFSVADDLAQRHHCEKIKTIGDCVMVAAGVPEASAKHAETLARYALDLKAAMQGETFADQPLRLRIGIHSGPAVAGVIGRNRFAYDLWGDTVNVAARIEQVAKPNEICLSDATRERLGAGFLCTAIGDVEVRGAGRIAIWRLDCEQRDESPEIPT
jgi:class 3 adenylate cyclase